MPPKLFLSNTALDEVLAEAVKLAEEHSLARLETQFDDIETANHSAPRLRIVDFAIWLRSYEDLRTLKARPFDHNLSRDEVVNALDFDEEDLEFTQAIPAFNSSMPKDVRLAGLKAGTKCPPEILERASELLGLNF